MCRNDKKLLRYELNLDLFGEVLDQPESTLEESSVGRVFITLAKAEQPSRWKRLLADNSAKPQNMGTWWELWEKHQKDLEKHAPEDDDEDDGDDDADGTAVCVDAGADAGAGGGAAASGGSGSATSNC